MWRYVLGYFGSRFERRNVLDTARWSALAIPLAGNEPANNSVQAFLPLLVLVFDHFFGLSRNLNNGHLGSPPKEGSSKGTRPSRQRLLITLLYGLSALLWGFASVSALRHTLTPTGTICPVGPRIETYVPLLQVAMCALDAILIVTITRLRQDDDDNGAEPDVPSFISGIFFTATIVILLFCMPSLEEREFAFIATNLHALDIRDLLLDSIFASCAITSGVFLLNVLHPTTIALIVSNLLLFGFQIPALDPAFLLPPLALGTVIKHTSIAALLLAPLMLGALPPRSSKAVPSVTATLHRRIAIGYGTIVAASLLLSVLFPVRPIDTTMSEAVNALAASAQRTTDEWTAQAKSSKTLAEAVTEYKRRYNMSPPPHFDKWYEYATEHNSAIIDDFDQIHRYLLPFWALEPNVIREKTFHLLQWDSIGMGGVRFRNNSLEQSPAIPGTHHWMTDTFDEMVKPFIQWIPDMDIAFNLGDEPQITVPFEKMQDLLSKAEETRQRAASTATSGTTTTRDAFSLHASQWADTFPDPIPREVIPQGWTEYVRIHLFENHISNACPPGAKARKSRWWDWSIACGACAAPHSSATRDGLLVANTSLARDLCHQPDMSYLNGFILSPGAMTGSNELFPIFSQARMSGFSDILIPSPWDFADKSAYNEEADLEWDQKDNALYWRGSHSDGIASYNTWPGFLRARFNHEAYDRHSKYISTNLPSSSSSSFRVNASFAGDVNKCDPRECASEFDTFRQWGVAVLPPSATDAEKAEAGARLPPSQPYDENFHFKHLIDMDGAGFSGRFIPFLRSRSLLYRSAVFHTWFDDRVQAWQHYIPVDARLGNGFWALVEYLSGWTGREKVSENGQAGEEIAKKVADQGRAWARMALRKEDMQIYLFRLLLEWARIVDDERETIGYNG